MPEIVGAAQPRSRNCIILSPANPKRKSVPPSMVSTVNVHDVALLSRAGESSARRGARRPAGTTFQIAYTASRFSLLIAAVKRSVDSITVFPLDTQQRACGAAVSFLGERAKPVTANRAGFL